MPAIVFHYISADLNINKEAPFRSIFLLGAQGSDPFFCYGHNLTPWFGRKNKADVQSFATKFHHNLVKESMTAMINYMNSRSSTYEKEVLKSYIKGYFFHYCCDRNIHPYVFYMSGFPTSSDNNKKLYSCLHSFYEADIDIAYYSRYKSGIPNASKFVKVKRKELKVVSKMYNYVAQNVYKHCNYFNDKSFYKASLDMRTTYNMLYSPLGIKKAIINKYMPISSANAACHATKEYKNFDYLNCEHNVWRDPVTGVSSDSSVIDLLESAKREYAQVESILEVKDQTLLKSYVNRFVHDIDFDGSPIDGVKKYSSPLIESNLHFLKYKEINKK